MDTQTYYVNQIGIGFENINCLYTPTTIRLPGTGGYCRMCDGKTVAPINLAYEVSTLKRFQNEITHISKPFQTYMYKQSISQENVT